MLSPPPPLSPLFLLSLFRRSFGSCVGTSIIIYTVILWEGAGGGEEEEEGDGGGWVWVGERRCLSPPFDQKKRGTSIAEAADRHPSSFAPYPISPVNRA